ncbi:MAG: IS66 family transposase [Xanthomonadales bacterium]|nr:IS66 family transposase [Xanthomonadales bacterium]
MQRIAERDRCIESQTHELAERTAALTERDQRIASQQRQLQNLDLTVQHLSHEVARLKRIQFGARTEALSALQRGLFEETVAEEVAAAEQALENAQSASGADAASPADAPIARPAKATPKRQALPPELPRITTVHEPATGCTCVTCAAALVKIGEHVSEKLAYTPGKFHVERHVHPQYACRACETVVAEPVAPSVIDRGLPAPSLLAQVLLAKYTDHLPLYRQQAIYARAGVELPRSTLADWVGACAVALQPLADRLREKLREQACLHADETPVDTLDPGNGKTQQSYLFAYRSTAGPPIVVFDYADSRSGKHAREFLGDWRGALMVDDYAGYKALFREGVTELACWVHVRRTFVEVVQASGSPLAQEAVERIGVLYRIEAEAKDQGLHGEALRAHRQQQATPRLTELHAWLQTLGLKALKNSGLAKAVNHALGRWPALLRYLEDSGRPIDNNPIETERSEGVVSVANVAAKQPSAIRPITLGRKNWLFIGGTNAGPRAAAIMSLVATAKANGVCPQAWLTDVLTRLPTTRNRDIDSLLPIEGWAALGG